MNTDSPLRYPGGKAAMAGILRSIRHLNGIGDRPIAEPFAGGAGASIGLLYKEEVPRVLINDADASIFCLWWALLHRSKEFLQRLSGVRASMAEWRRQRAVYSTGRRRSRLDRGFAAFYLNRCNRSGVIVNGGPIGGVDQSGAWKIDARFNKADLAQRCGKLAEYKDRIAVSCEDGVSFIQRVSGDGVFLFVDPPYYKKGRTLYLNKLEPEYHQRLASVLASLRDAPWVLTYDDCQEVRNLYSGWANVKSYGLRYTASSRGMGREVIVTPKWLVMPRDQSSLAIRW